MSQFTSSSQRSSKKLLILSSCMLGFLTLVGFLVWNQIKNDFENAVFFAPLIGLSFLATIFGLFNKISIGAYLFTFGSSFAGALGEILSTASHRTFNVSLLVFLIFISGFLLSHKVIPVLGIFNMMVFLFLEFYLFRNGDFHDHLLTHDVPVLFLFLLVIVVGSFLKRRMFLLTTQLQEHIVNYQNLMNEINSSGKKISTVAEEIHSLINKQQQGTFRQSSAVKETREALHSTLNASREISRSAQAVYENAHTTSQHSEKAASKVATLAERARSISEILDKIKSIATKSELLALNASLESTKAGKSGRSFSLLASQMRQLTENVMESLKDIRSLTKEIREATHAVQLSMEETIKIARATTEAGREISLITQQQQTSTEQVTSAMDDIAEIISIAALGSEQTLLSMQELLNVASNIPELLSKNTTLRP